MAQSATDVPHLEADARALRRLSTAFGVTRGAWSAACAGKCSARAALAFRSAAEAALSLAADAFVTADAAARRAARACFARGSALATETRSSGSASFGRALATSVRSAAAAATGCGSGAAGRQARGRPARCQHATRGLPGAATGARSTARSVVVSGQLGLGIEAAGADQRGQEPTATRCTHERPLLQDSGHHSGVSSAAASSAMLSRLVSSRRSSLAERKSSSAARLWP